MTNPIGVAIPDPRTEPTLSVDRTAELFGTGEYAVRAAIRAGDLEAIHVGRLIRIPTAVVLRMLGLV